MKWNIVEGNWKQLRGEVKAGWNKLVNDHIGVNAGKRIESAGKIGKALSKEECMMKNEIQSRRDVLRGALAVGCSLFLPIAFSGCDSKKSTTSTNTAPASSPATSAVAATPAVTNKASQASVHYQQQPKGEQKCGICLNFIAESNTCKLVEGQINPEGWCVLWMQKA